MDVRAYVRVHECACVSVRTHACGLTRNQWRQRCSTEARLPAQSWGSVPVNCLQISHAHKMMSSLRITSHCTQNDVIIEHYITLHTKRWYHWGLHHTAHKLTSSLSITSPNTKQKCHGALHHTAHRMVSSFIYLFFAVPSSVPTSEALLPRRSSRHPPPPATPRAHSASRPHPYRSTYCAPYWRQCEPSRGVRLSERPPESRPPLRPSTNPPMWTLWRWGLWSELPQAREEGGTPRLRPPRECGMKGYRCWDLFKFIFMQRSMRVRMVTDDAMKVHFRFETTWQGRRPRLLSWLSRC